MPIRNPKREKLFVLVSREVIWGGGEVFLRDLGVALASLGFTCILRVYQGSALSSENKGLPVRPAFSFTYKAIVVVNDFRSLWQSLLLDRFAKRIFIIHGPWQISTIRALICRTFNIRSYAVNSQIIELCAELGYKNVHLIPLGPERELRSNLPAPLPATSELTFGMVARLDPIKRHHIFSEVVETAGARGILVCPPPETTAQIDLLQTLAGNRVDVFSDGDSNHVWLNCNLYLCTSKYESLGLAILESLNHGIPVISLAEGGPVQLLSKTLSLGLIQGSAPSMGDLESAISQIRHNWSQYWIDAANLLEARGPLACAKVILEGLRNGS
jgi:glycosyltransferase involved in cell wall biosynthesis